MHMVRLFATFWHYKFKCAVFTDIQQHFVHNKSNNSACHIASSSDKCLFTAHSMKRQHFVKVASIFAKLQENV